MADNDDLRSEYSRDELGEGVRGKYFDRYTKDGRSVVLLEPDIARAFPDSKAVNEALRQVLAERSRSK